MSCVTKKYKNRNITNSRNINYNPDKYLSPKELRKLSCSNDLTKYKKHVSLNLTRKYNKKLQDLKLISYKQPKLLINLNQFVNTRRVGISPTFYSIHEKHKDYIDYYHILNGIHTNVLDVSKLAKGFTYFNIYNLKLSPSEDYIAFNVDFDGSRVYHLFIKPLYLDDIKELNISKSHEVMLSTHDSFGHTRNYAEVFTWLDSEHIAYVLNNKYYNNNKSYVYNIYTQTRRLIHTNKHTFINFNTTSDGYYHILSESDYNSDYVYIFNIMKPSQLLFKQTKDVSFPIINHIDGLWYILERNKGVNIIKTSTNFKTFKILYKNNNTSEVVKYMYVFNNIIYFILITERKKYVNKLIGTKLSKLLEFDKKYYLDFDSYKNCVNRHSNLSPIKSFDLFYKGDTSIETNTKYIERNVYINPLLFFTMMYKKGLSLQNAKCVVYGYGTYGDDFDRGYTPEIKYLLEKGYLVIYAHLRGGGENGFKSYDEGRLLNKINTFDDMIECIHYLFKHNYTSRDKLAIWGRSAGGLLIAAVLNKEPNICKLAILGVPFIMVTKTLYSNKHPLSFESHSEYGDPRIYKYKQYMELYDPLKNINPDGDYPNIYIYTNINDTLVPYKHPLSYYTELKKKVKNPKEINIYIENKYGHTQGSAVSDKHRSISQIYAQIERFIV